MSEQIQINDVSDTSLWVAYYRAKESLRPDALFHDEFAGRLAGEKGRRIAESMPEIGRYTEYAVVTRTFIIDEFIQNLIREGVDTVINLGAGLDTRPYRLSLPPELHWIEVDYPRINEHKKIALKSETPQCQLNRVDLDLANDRERRQFLSDTNAAAKNILVITEGVLPYLTETQVSLLAQDLLVQPKINFWIAEYFHSGVYPYLKTSLRTKAMQNSPFVFYPENWLGFFENLGWIKKEIRYSGEEGKKRGRPMPMPWWVTLVMKIAPKALMSNSDRMSGYLVFKKK